MIPVSFPQIQTRWVRSATTLAALLLLGLWPAVSRSQATADDELVRGITLVRSGSYDAAIDPLNAAIRQFAIDPARNSQLARAYLYLAAAFFRLDQKVAARAAFTQALRADAVLNVDGEGLPGNVTKYFRETRKDINLAALPPRPTPPPSAPDVFAASADADLERGVAQSRSGDPAALVTLEAVLRRVGAQAEGQALRVRALLFVAVAHLSANREAEARAALSEALALRPDLVLPDGQFAPSFVTTFQAVKAAARTP
jgi:tetratricopeptide (TPR) repeat protein